MTWPKGRRGRRKLQSIAFPVVGGGIGWTAKPDEREVVNEFFVVVSGRRVLSERIECEGEDYVNRSILDLKDRLTETLQRLPEGSASAPNVRSMRDACNAYLSATPGPEGFRGLRPEFEQALWTWRQRIYEDVRDLAHGLDLPEAHRVMRDMRASFG